MGFRSAISWKFENRLGRKPGDPSAAKLNPTLGLDTKGPKISANLSESKHCVASY